MKRAEILVLLAIVGLCAYASFRFDGFIQDDAFIFARYAQNILDGNGFVYNAGEYTEGATSFLWTLLGAFGGWLGADIPEFLKMAGAVSVLLWLIAFFGVCGQWLTRPWQWLPPVLLFAVYPPLALWSQGGLETCFFGFLAMAGFYLAEAWHRHGTKKTFRGLLLVSALLLLTRPEGMPVVALYGLYLWMYPHAGRRAWSYTYFLPVVLLTLGGLLTFRYLYFHDWVPNTYYAKGGGGFYLWRYGLGRFNMFLKENANFVFLTLSLPVFFMRQRIWVPMLMVPLWCLYYIKSGGDILPEHRLLLPAFPFMLLGTFYFLDGIREFYASKLRERYYNIALLAAAVLFVLQYEGYYHQKLVAFTQVRSALELTHGDLGRYLDSHMTTHDTAILTDAGMTALYAQDKHIVDWLGLCDRRVAHILYDSGYNPWALSYCKDEEEKARRQQMCWTAMESYFEELAPRYVVLNIFLDGSTEDQLLMIRYAEEMPDELPDFITDRISFSGYFGIFTAKNRARGYKPVRMISYNPDFWMVLVERQ